MTPALKLQYIGYQTGYGQRAGFRLYNVLVPGQTHLPVGSTISEQTVRTTVKREPK